MFSTDFIFRQQENLVDNQKCQAGFRPLCNKILLLSCKGDMIASQENNCYIKFVQQHLKRHLKSLLQFT